jgi:hypothetical protein
MAFFNANCAPVRGPFRSFVNRASISGLGTQFIDQDWDTAQKVTKIESLVHKQQAEALLLFAERFKWPYINEARPKIDNLYNDIEADRGVPVHLFDWAHGLTFPG